MSRSISFWIKISVINLLLVATLGLLMRYKIAYSLPFFDQKHLQHAHSHFAFSGWVSQSIYAAMVWFFKDILPAPRMKKYNLLLWLNLVSSFGMLVTFSVGGYTAISITFSTGILLVSFLFAGFYWYDSKAFRSQGFHRWFAGAHFFNVISAAGTIGLAWVMVNQIANTEARLASLYYYLHFQYNGWFFFAGMGMLLFYLKHHLNINPEMKTIFRLMFYSAIPAYFLSTLWAKLPLWLYLLTLVAAAVQTIGWILILKKGLSGKWFPRARLPKTVYWLFILSTFAFCIKFFLQMVSVHPELSRLAFGFRNIVIAYLHLVLLAGFTLFLLAYFQTLVRGIYRRTLASMGLVIIAIGVFFNEFILLVQGIAGFLYIPIPFAASLLLAAAFIIWAGVATLITGMRGHATEINEVRSVPGG